MSTFLPRGLLVCALLASLVAVSFGARAQAPPDESAPASPETPPPVEVIATGDVLTRAVETGRKLRSLEERSRDLPGVAAVRDELHAVSDAWTEQAREALGRLDRESGPLLVDEIDRVWTGRMRTLARWNEMLSARVGALDRDLQQLDGTREVWKRTLDLEGGLPPALRRAVLGILDEIERTRRTLRERRDDVLALQSAMVERSQLVEDVQERVSSVRKQFDSRMFKRESPALWTALTAARSADPVGILIASWRDWWAALVNYVRQQTEGFTLVLMLLLAGTAGIALLGRRAARWAERDAALSAAARVLSRPASAALLLLLIAYPLILPQAPLLLRWFMGLAVIVPALRLIALLLEGSGRRVVYFLSMWFAADSLRMLLLPTPLLARSLLLIEAAVALTGLSWLQRRARSEPASEGRDRLHSSRLVGLAGALLAISLVANLIGNTTLAEVLVRGTLLAAFFAYLLEGSARVLDGLWAVLLHTRTLSRLRGVQRYEDLLRRRGSTLVRWGLGGLWLWSALGFFRLGGPVREAAVAVLGATWPVGDLDLSLGDLVAFGVTIWVAIWLSRSIRFVLDEDVLPRAGLPRGVPYAISSGIHYVILFLGFALAVSAAGFDTSRFALIVGALGVGIGLGLQGIVNNFVSGLVLLFERPVQTGDIVQVGDLFGEVRHIGMRCSTVRTWSGAEVIVPNSKLVSENVVNWTLSDQQRRIEIPIGVAYGSEPERVLALLLELARAHEQVLADPAPTAIFVGHGQSSLDFELRAWTVGDWVSVKSDLGIAINRALREAGIEIPFPQRDLHVRSVEARVADALRGSSGE